MKSRTMTNSVVSSERTPDSRAALVFFCVLRAHSVNSADLTFSR